MRAFNLSEYYFQRSCLNKSAQKVNAINASSVKPHDFLVIKVENRHLVYIVERNLTVILFNSCLIGFEFSQKHDLITFWFICQNILKKKGAYALILGWEAYNLQIFTPQLLQTLVNPCWIVRPLFKVCFALRTFDTYNTSDNSKECKTKRSDWGQNKPQENYALKHSYSVSTSLKRTKQRRSLDRKYQTGFRSVE